MNYLSLLACACFACALLVGCGPSCEDQGKVTVMVGAIPVTIMSGNVPIVINQPIYSCMEVKR